MEVIIYLTFSVVNHKEAIYFCCCTEGELACLLLIMKKHWHNLRNYILSISK